MDYNLKGLADILEKIEDHAREKNETTREKNNPRNGYDYNDPWYDERHTFFNYRHARNGSHLERDDIMEAIWHFVL